MDTDDLSRSADGVRRVTVTARALLLTRDLSVQESESEIHHPERGFEVVPWHFDTAYGGLGLTCERIEAWRGGRVLDVASGLSIVGTELSELGIGVDCIDIELHDEHASFAKVADLVKTRYPAGLRHLRELSESGAARYALTAAERALLDTLIERADATVGRYPQVSGKRALGDATKLSALADATYDGVMCGWLMVHLEPEDERRAIESMIRVTKPGGAVHLCTGYGGDAAERIGAWLGSRAIIEDGRYDQVTLRAPPS